MNKELNNRESRLRYKAKQKGLRIQKEHYGEHSGYLICKEDSRLVVAGYNHPFRNLLSIEEAEEFVNEY